MKRLLALLLITLGLSFSLNAQQPTKRRTRKPPSKTPVKTPLPDQAAWEKFTSEPGRFSVLMPGSPTDKSKTVGSDYGPYISHLLVLRGLRNVFIIGWADYPPGFTLSKQTEMEVNRDNFVSGVSAKLLHSRPLIIDGYKAIEFTCESPDKIYKSRVYMVGRRPYQIVIGSPKGEDDSVNVNRFLNSFKVSVN